MPEFAASCHNHMFIAVVAPTSKCPNLAEKRPFVTCISAISPATERKTGNGPFICKLNHSIADRGPGTPMAHENV